MSARTTPERENPTNASLERRQRPTLQAVLFDKDGTLFDFRQSWAAITDAVLDRLAPDAAARREMALAAGFDPEARSFVPGSAIVAEPTSATARLWSRWRPDLGAERLESMLNREAVAAADRPGTMVPAVPDLPALLGELRRRGLILGVATHDEEAAARRQLAAVGALDAFEFIAGYDSGHGLKPGPGMLAAFAAATGLPAAAIAVVGDSRHDLEMARAGAAGRAVGVLTGPAARSDLAPLADEILESIAALPEMLDRVARPTAT